jgi:cold shock protein
VAYGRRRHDTFDATTGTTAAAGSSGVGRLRPDQLGDVIMQGTIYSLRPERGFGFIRDTKGAEVFFHRSAVTPPEGFSTLAVGMEVEFEPEAGPKGLRTAKLTVTPVKTPPLRSFEELAAHSHRYAAG